MLIPGKDACILWNNAAPTIGGDDVLVIHKTDMFADLEALNERYAESAGAHQTGWMKGSHALHTPEGIFALGWLYGPASPTAKRAALREFAKIEECGWARRMIEVLEAADGLDS